MNHQISSEWLAASPQHGTAADGYSGHTVCEREFRHLFPTNAFVTRFWAVGTSTGLAKLCKWVWTHNPCSSSRKHGTSQTALLGRNSQVASLCSRHLLRRLVENPTEPKATFSLTNSYNGMEESVREGNAGKVPCCIFYEIFYYVLMGRKKQQKHQADISVFLKVRRTACSFCQEVSWVSQAVWVCSAHGRAWAVQELLH